jgi:O-antigen/teichoic acid export membrane protein
MSINIHTLDAKSRSKNIKIQVVLSFFSKGSSILLSLYIVPLTIGYLGKEIYGIWVTMLSIISWISLSDIGIGHGLKNKLAVSLALNETEKSKAYISTAYVLLSSISIFILIISFLIFPFVNWEMFFNSVNLKIPYSKIMLAFMVFITTTFSMGIINTILAACQLNSWSSYTSLISSVFFISFLILIPSFFTDNLLSIVLVYGISNVIALGIISLFFFHKFNSVVQE